MLFNSCATSCWLKQGGPVKKVAVILLNWNGWRDTVACLRSLRQLDYPAAQMLVVDNASSDDSVAQIGKAMPGIAVLQTGANLGFGGGCNAGLRQAMAQGADYLWLVNSDAVADPSALSALVAKAESDGRLGAVGSVLYETEAPGSVQLWGGGQVNLWTGQSRHRLRPGPLDFISGASVLLRRSALEQVGLFDSPRYFMYWEDTDLHFRLRKAGWRFAVADNSRLWHKQSASLGRNSPALDRYFTQSGVRFFKRHAPYPFIPISFMVGKMLAKRVVTGEWQRARAVLKGLRSA